MNLYYMDGWEKPNYSKKQHYFINNISVCGEWKIFSSSLKPVPWKGFPVCEKCEKKRKGK